MKNDLDQLFKKNQISKKLSVDFSIELSVVHKKKVVFNYSYGQKKYKYFDLASLTKIIFTMTEIIKCYSDNHFSLNDKVIDHLPYFSSKNIKIKDLLTHTSGLLWHYPFYKELNLKNNHNENWNELIRKLLTLKIKKTGQSVYSDLDFFILGQLLLIWKNKSIDSILDNTLKNLNLPSLHYCNNNISKYEKKYYAPTEKCIWRKKIIQGEVHDENAWALKGVSTHACLFGTIEDLNGYLLKLIFEFESNKNYQLFCSRALPLSKGSWALGYCLPDSNNSLLGERFSKKSFGHWAFTGPSVWYDPDHELGVSILCNQFFPNRKNKVMSQLRPLIHDLIFNSIIMEK